jgi:proline dehydrogenase
MYDAPPLPALPTAGGDTLPSMLRSAILAVSRSSRIERLVQTAPVTRDMVTRFVAGTGSEDALRATRQLVGEDLRITLDYLGEDTRNPEQAASTKDEYLRLLKQLANAQLRESAEVSLKLSALGQLFDETLAYEHAHAICAAAAAAGTFVTLDMEDHTTTDATLDALQRLRQDFPATGAVLQAYLRRTEGDCRELATPGSRVRLVKGAYKEPESVAFQSAVDVDRSFVRCLNILMSNPGYPMVATHDPRLIAIAQDRARWFDRSPDEFEFQMLYGVRPQEQHRLAGEGYRVRVYVPYGTQWYGYLMRRLAERPANLAFFLRAVASRR